MRVCVDEMTQLVAEIVQALTAAQNDPDMGRESGKESHFLSLLL